MTCEKHKVEKPANSTNPTWDGDLFSRHLPSPGSYLYSVHRPAVQLPHHFARGKDPHRPAAIADRRGKATSASFFPRSRPDRPFALVGAHMPDRERAAAAAAAALLPSTTSGCLKSIEAISP